MSDTGWADVLPNDKILCQRSEKWREVFQKFKEMGEDENSSVGIDETLPMAFDEAMQQQQSYAESVSVSEFEDNAAEEDDFDVEDVMNQTKQVIEKRKESWNRSGIGYMTNPFAFDNISDRVYRWLQNDCDFFSSNFVRESEKNCINGPKIDHKNIVVEKCFDELSDSSVDTAKYILSNRKRRKSKLTMTIKQFCYSAQNNVVDKQFHLKNIISGDYALKDALNVGRKKMQLRIDDRSSLARKSDFCKRKHFSRTICYSSTSSSSDCAQKLFRKTTKKPQSSRKNVYSSDELESYNNRSNGISRKSVCKSRNNSKKRISTKLRSKSVNLPSNPEFSSEKCDSDQLTDASPMKKEKRYKGKYHSDQTSTSDYLSDEDEERRRPNIRKLRRPELRKSSNARVKHITPQKITRKLPVEHISSTEEGCSDPSVQLSPIKKPKNFPTERQSEKSSFINSFFVDAKQAHAKEDKHRLSQENIEPSRASDRLKGSKEKQGQPEQWREYRDSVSRKVLAKNRMPITRRRNTESNSKATNDIPTSVSELNLTHNGVINSTALKSQDSMIHCKETFENICNNIVKGVNSHKTKLQDSTISSCNSKDLSGINSSGPILLYSPLVKKLSNRISETGKVIITENDLEANLGTHLKNRFLGNQREFRYECQANAKLIFIPPTDRVASGISSGSEEDICDTIARTHEGEIMEITKLSDANRSCNQ